LRKRGLPRLTRKVAYMNGACGDVAS
jgi:hypothetical protein